MFEEEIEFLYDHVDWLENNDWDYLRTEAFDSRISWDNLRSIFDSPDINIDYRNFNDRMNSWVNLLDPTTDKKYDSWIREQFIEGNILGKNWDHFINPKEGEIISREYPNIMTEALQKYDAYMKYILKTYIPESINRYSNVIELHNDAVIDIDPEIFALGIQRQLEKLFKTFKDEILLKKKGKIIAKLKAEVMIDFENGYYDYSVDRDRIVIMVCNCLNAFGYEVSNADQNIEDITNNIIQTIDDYDQGKIDNLFYKGKL